MNNHEVYIDKNGIMCVEHPEHAILTLRVVDELRRRRLSMTPKKTPLLVITHGVTSITDDVQKYISSAEHATLTSAVAVVRDPRAGYFEYSAILLEIFKVIYRPRIEFKIFDDKTSALKWLARYL